MRKIIVCTNLSEKDKKGLEVIANDWGVQPGLVIRRLILFLLQEKISFLEIVKKSNMHEKHFECRDSRIRTTISKEEKEKLLVISKEWDFTISTVLRRIIKVFVVGGISKKELW